MSSHDRCTFNHFAQIAKDRGVPLPEDLDNFEYRQCPLFHSIWVAAFGLNLTVAQGIKLVDFAVSQPTDDCCPTLAEYAVSLIRR